MISRSFKFWPIKNLHCKWGFFCFFLPFWEWFLLCAHAYTWPHFRICMRKRDYSQSLICFRRMKYLCYLGKERKWEIFSCLCAFSSSSVYPHREDTLQWTRYMCAWSTLDIEPWTFSLISECTRDSRYTTLRISSDTLCPPFEIYKARSEATDRIYLSPYSRKTSRRIRVAAIISRSRSLCRILWWGKTTYRNASDRAPWSGYYTPRWDRFGTWYRCYRAPCSKDRHVADKMKNMYYYFS